VSEREYEDLARQYAAGQISRRRFITKMMAGGVGAAAAVAFAGSAADALGFLGRGRGNVYGNVYGRHPGHVYGRPHRGPQQFPHRPPQSQVGPLQSGPVQSGPVQSGASQISGTPDARHPRRGR
jgi:hypothetical protein